MFSRFITIRRIDDPKMEHTCAYRALTAYMTSQKYADENQTPWKSFTTNADVKKNTLAQKTKEVMTMAGIDDQFDSDSLRHAAITYWIQKGLTREKVMERTGHTCLALVNLFYDKSNNDNDIMANLANRRVDTSDDEGFAEEEEESEFDEYDGNPS